MGGAREDFTQSPAAAHTFLVLKRGEELAEAIEREARRVTSMLDVSPTRNPAARERGLEILGEIRAAVAAAEALLPYLRWAPRAVDRSGIESAVRQLIALWREILPKRGRPLDSRTHFSKFLLAWDRRFVAGRGEKHLTSDEICAAAVVAELAVEPSERRKLREVFKKASVAGQKALEAEEARVKRIASMLGRDLPAS